MFQLHIAYSLELLVLGAGLSLIYLGMKQASLLLKIGGFLLAGITVLNMLCTLYYGVRYWEDGYFRTLSGPVGIAAPPMMGGDSDMGQKADCPMMKKMMEGKKMMMERPQDGKNAEEAPPPPEDHDAHH